MKGKKLGTLEDDLEDEEEVTEPQLERQQGSELPLGSPSEPVTLELSHLNKDKKKVGQEWSFCGGIWLACFTS